MYWMCSMVAGLHSMLPRNTDTQRLWEHYCTMEPTLLWSMCVRLYDCMGNMVVYMSCIYSKGFQWVCPIRGCQGEVSEGQLSTVSWADSLTPGDYVVAQVPSPLTEDMERQRREKVRNNIVVLGIFERSPVIYCIICRLPLKKKEQKRHAKKKRAQEKSQREEEVVVRRTGGGRRGVEWQGKESSGRWEETCSEEYQWQLNSEVYTVEFL